MNAAEITDKLGLHSLRQRAWVSHDMSLNLDKGSSLDSTSSQLALHPEMVYTKVLSGSATPSRRLATLRVHPTSTMRQDTNLGGHCNEKTVWSGS